MAYATSRLFYFGLAKQSAFNTPLAPTAFPRWLDGSGVEPDAQFEELPEGDGSQDMSLVFKTKQLWKPKLVFYPRPQELGEIVAAMMGAGSDTVTGAAAPYTHTFTIKDAPAYYSIEMGMTDPAVPAANRWIVRVQDCVLTNFDLEGEANRPLKTTAEYVGRKAQLLGTAATVTLEAADCMRFVNGVFTINGSDLSARITKFKITVNRGVDDNIMTNEITPKDFIWGSRKISIDFEILYDSNDFMRLVYFGGTSGTTDSPNEGIGSIDFTFYKSGDPTQESFEIKIPKVFYTGKPVAPRLDGRVLRQEISAVAARPASGSILECVLTNSRSTAY
jgi:hypothetical protein